MTDDATSKPISLRQAARREQTNDRFIRRLIEEGWLRAWRRQGPKRSRFFVMAHEVRPAINAATAYVPTTPKRDRCVIVGAKVPLHPAVKC